MKIFARERSINSLFTGPALYQMLPNLYCFITVGIKHNLLRADLTMLTLLVRMAKAFLENPCLNSECYLHQLVPTLLSCVLCRQLCTNPAVDNHWALGNYSSQLIAYICRTYISTNIQLRITTSRLEALLIGEESIPLVTLYGAIVILSDLGVMKASVLPHVKAVANELSRYLLMTPAS